MRTPYQDEGYGPFQEETLGALEAFETYAVCLADGENQIKVVSTEAEAAASIGVLRERYDLNTPDVQVSFFNKEGSFRGKAGAVFSKGAPVAPDETGKFVEVAEADAVGRYIGQEDTAVDDVIEILTK